MACTGKVVKEYMILVPKNAEWSDIVYACNEIAAVLTQMATIKAMVDAQKEK